MRAAASAVLGSDQVVANPYREQQKAPDLDLFLVRAEGYEQGAHVGQPPVVDATQTLGNRAPAAPNRESQLAMATAARWRYS